MCTMINNLHIFEIKKESPNEGTETGSGAYRIQRSIFCIKKESPNEGTETSANAKSIFNCL